MTRARAPRKPKALRCPRCGKADLSIAEKSDAFTTFDQDAEGRIDPEGNHSHGLITGLSAKCAACGHAWPVRGAKQIAELAGYPQDRPSP